MIAATSPKIASRFLERALLFAFVVHAVALLTMVLFLLPGMPGGVADSTGRALHVASHPWLWRLGWLPWHLTAAAELFLAFALLRTPWIPRIPAGCVLLISLVAVVPDQMGQWLWVTQGVALARQAAQTGDLTPYLHFEATVYALVAGWGALLYTLAAIGWTWCFSSAGTWSRHLTWLSGITWTLFAAAAVAPLLPSVYRPAPALIAAVNAVGFPLLLLWFILVAECVLRRARPMESHGCHAPWQYPTPGLMGRVISLLCNSCFLRTLLEGVPMPSLRSDITDTFYINYLAEADRLEPLVPYGLELQRIGPEGKYAVFSFIICRHGHFGPALLGPLRRLFPSPIQFNCRVYVRDPRTGNEGIYFVTNALSSRFAALTGRLCNEGMPMHMLQQAAMDRGKDGEFHLSLNPGEGSGPDVKANLHFTANRDLPSPWNECFPDYGAMLAYCVPQHRAISSQPWYGRITRQEMNLGMELEACQPMEGTVESRTADAAAGRVTPLVFYVPSIGFHFTKAEYDLLPALEGG